MPRYDPIHALKGAALVVLIASSSIGWAASRKPVEQRPSVERSVVRVVNYQQGNDWFKPWDTLPVAEVSGTGFVMAPGMVLTNAHVVSNSRLLVLYLNDDPDPHPAEVAFLAHDCDLALVRVQDPLILKNIPALPLGGLARIGSPVDTLGYPAGGTQLSSTRGVVSRIEPRVYAHSNADRHLTGQTDAAINPGNSGGPVFQDGLVVGVAFQAIEGLQNVGYFIPTEVIGRFLHDVEDGRYDGYPDLGIETANLDNPAPRRRAGMQKDESGVIVESVRPGTGAYGVVHAGDVILSVEGKKVANDGSISENGLRFPFGMLVDRKLLGERSEIGLLRDGRRFSVSVPLSRSPALDLRSNAYDRKPRYFIFGGLVFVPLELETLKTFGSEWPTRADRALIHEFAYRVEADPSKLNEERVVLLRRLDHPVNAGIAFYKNMAVERVNGQPVRNLEELIEVVANSDAPSIVIEFSNYRRVAVIDRLEALRANEEILRRYGIEKDRSL